MVPCTGTCRRLWFEIRNALNRLQGVKLAGIGVDAWGVDYALLGERGELLQNPYHYRDRRTDGVMDEVFRRVSREEIYRATGIQFMPINTLYQLYAAHRDTPSIVAAAKQLLTIPDLFNYWLTGKAVCEFTNATTTQMVDPVRRAWARDLMEKAGLRADLLSPIVEPGTVIGPLLPTVAPNFITGWNSSDRASLSRYRFRRGSHYGARWYRLSEFRNVVVNWDRTRCPGSHLAGA